MSGQALMRLATLLAREKAALLSGDFAALGTLVEPKQDLLDALSKPSADTPSLDTIEALERDLAQTARLLEAALAGLRDGRARAEALRAARDGFATYDRDGQSWGAGAATPVLRRRA